MRLWRTTKHENRVQQTSYIETSGAVIQASVVGDCLKVGSLCDDTDPADKTDPGKGITVCRTRKREGRMTVSAPDLRRSNRQLANVATDVFGMSGRLMLRALIEGKATPQEMAELAKGMRCSRAVRSLSAASSRCS
jgi:hypothetical protein